MHRKKFQVTTDREGDIIDITADVKAVVGESGISDGMVNVFVTGSTAAVTTIEYESGALDLRRALSVIAPTTSLRHDGRWATGTEVSCQGRSGRPLPVCPGLGE
jgi:thiamine phosphate synthase YjbQ (UPF0047 family)